MKKLSIINLITMKYPNTYVGMYNPTGDELSFEEAYKMVDWRKDIKDNVLPDPIPTWEEFSNDPLIYDYVYNYDVTLKKEELSYKVKELHLIKNNKLIVTYEGVDYNADEKSRYNLSSSITDVSKQIKWIDSKNKSRILSNNDRKNILSLILDKQQINIERKQELREIIDASSTMEELESIQYDKDWAN